MSATLPGSVSRSAESNAPCGSMSGPSGESAATAKSHGAAPANARLEVDSFTKSRRLKPTDLPPLSLRRASQIPPHLTQCAEISMPARMRSKQRATLPTRITIRSRLTARTIHEHGLHIAPAAPALLHRMAHGLQGVDPSLL